MGFSTTKTEKKQLKKMTSSALLLSLLYVAFAPGTILPFMSL